MDNKCPGTKENGKEYFLNGCLGECDFSKNFLEHNLMDAQWFSQTKAENFSSRLYPGELKEQISVRHGQEKVGSGLESHVKDAC